jgi:hypothetical protein
MNKQQLVAKIENAWVSFNEAYAGLTEEQMVAPGVTGEWSVKELLAHVTTWEEEALKTLPLILRGERIPRYADVYGGLDAFNALKAAEKRTLTLDETVRALEATHQQLVAYVRDAPDAEIVRETRFRRRLRLDTYSHYPIHDKAIRAWREAKGW